jgi:nitroreductase
MSRPAVFSLVAVLALGMSPVDRLAGQAIQAVQATQAITLPAPQTDGGRPLMQVLKTRHTSREFSTEQLPLQVLSNLLWAAFGVNREDGRRTAPSAVNWQEIDVYVCLQEGTYVYRAKENRLEPVVAADVRAATGGQAFAGTVPVDLVYVADFAKTGKIPAEQRDIWSPADAGFIAENVYLFCASEGLNVVVRGLIDKAALAQKLQLRPDQRIWLAQSIGYPKK